MDDATRAELWDLSVRYAGAADSGQPEEFADLFSERAILRVHNGGAQQLLSGRDQLRSIPELLRRFERTFHFLGQSRYWWGDDGQARGEILCTANHLSEGTNMVMFIRYQDGYEQIDGHRWRISVRDVLIQWTEAHGISSRS
jgi:hypothetical protein